MNTIKAASNRRWHRAAGIALAGLMAFATGGVTAQNLVKNGDFTQYVAPYAANPNSGLPYASFLTRDARAVASTTGGYLYYWDLNAYTAGGTIPTTFGPASQLITTDGNDALFRPVAYPNPAPVTQNSACCLLAWSKKNIQNQYDNGNHGYTAPPDQVTNTWDGRGPNGANYWMTDVNWNPTSMSQTLTGLQMGQQYQLSFDWAVGQLVFAPLGDGATAGWKGFIDNTGFNTSLLTITPEGFSGWQKATFTFTATTTSSVLSFIPVGSGTPPLAMLSGISVVAVPEPETMLMFGFGLTALMLMRRRMR